MEEGGREGSRWINYDKKEAKTKDGGCESERIITIRTPLIDAVNPSVSFFFFDWTVVVSFLIFFLNWDNIGSPLFIARDL